MMLVNKDFSLSMDAGLKYYTSLKFYFSTKNKNFYNYLKKNVS